ncbi:unnamed protein product [Rotaria sordida]|uniref:BHLH domain-containing protein n=1 Tax=Rotaria sordida TaxID=392033 RepID=A0A814NSC1_9BILA|nr:unnamed protein product [Rotaria sordida]CAF1094292.1 unnamed protein product [Rotaria sordida]CAF3628296.1 unnamed protein product [Rotaria sordida]CAF3726647.1 unnamed protein product [Rotaria sordida]
MLKLKPIEIGSNHVVINTNTITTSVIPQSNPVKRSRKSAHPSKTIQTSIDSSFLNQLTKTRSNIQIEESTDDELLNLSQINNIDEQENNDDDGNISDEETTSIRYENLTSKRPRLTYDKRLEANARERERVHNLTAAFESLRQVIPMYGDQPKLSRLSILRIACSYVLVLGSLNEIDFSQEQNAYTFNECFHILSSTILNELKRKKIK